jgi:DNA-binding NtrC family response regulator
MPKPHKHAVLLVDDEPEILFSLKGLLRHEYELHTAESADEAMKILANHHVHVIMTDQRMPEVTGSELLGQVKNTYPDAIRIVFTGYADIKAVIESVNNGGLFRYITKPWDPDDLLQVLREATAKYDEVVETRQLLDDARDHLHRVQELLQSRADKENLVVIPGEVAEQIAQQGANLLDRVAKAIDS